MKKYVAWLLLFAALAFGGYRIWDRNTQPPPPPAVITQPVAQPAPAPAPETSTPAPTQPRAKTPAPKAKPKAKHAPAPAPAQKRPAPAAPPVSKPVDTQFPRGGAINGAALPVSCDTVRWYATHAPAIGQKLADAYHPTAAQIAAAKACLKG